jgi:hypothetical protein
MRYTITLTKTDGGTVALSQCKRPSAAENLFDAAVQDALDWMRRKADAGMTVVSGALPDGGVAVLMCDPANGWRVIAKREVRLVDNRQPDTFLADAAATLSFDSCGNIG